ncbi:MAG TPA: amidase [Gemmatimonadaceae bacterium]|nr:amidase [Gemmatimonadaceae bacterium]
MRLPGELNSLGLMDAASRIATGDVSPVELTSACLERIAAVDGEVNAFITVTEDEAVYDARRIELELAHGDSPGALSGVPIALKDLFDTAGIRTTAGSKFFAERVPVANAVVVDKLRDAGAVVLGKLNMHEWALGVTNDNPHYGACHNPSALDRITGGSSGGSAAAIAAGMCSGALGSDTGGSIRIPASLCGVVGLKPTYGRVSTRGVVPLSWSLDHVGPMARHVVDAAQLLQVIAGRDAADPGSAQVRGDDYLGEIEDGVDGWRVGVIADEWLGELAPDVKAAFQAAVNALASAGAWIEELAAPELPEAARLNGLMTTADAAAFHRERMEVSPDDFGADVLTRLRRGAGYGATDYADARRQQTVFRRTFESWFVEHGGAMDVVVLPTTPCAAPKIAGLDAVATAGLLTRLTAPFNFTGLPALSVPCGMTGDGLPVGLQIVGAPWAERRVLCAGRAYELASQR